jgi:hypothetical protein
MFVRGAEHFYVNELTKLIDGSYIIPIRWVIFHGILHCDAYHVVINNAVSDLLSFK